MTRAKESSLYKAVTSVIWNASRACGFWASTEWVGGGQTTVGHQESQGMRTRDTLTVSWYKHHSWFGPFTAIYRVCICTLHTEVRGQHGIVHSPPTMWFWGWTQAVKSSGSSYRLSHLSIPGRPFSNLLCAINETESCLMFQNLNKALIQ